MTEKPAPKENRLEAAAIKQQTTWASSNDPLHDIAADLDQFKRLRFTFPDLSNDELAHRMAITPRQLKIILKHLEK